MRLGTKPTSKWNTNTHQELTSWVHSPSSGGRGGGGAGVGVLLSVAQELHFGKEIKNQLI